MQSDKGDPIFPSLFQNHFKLALLGVKKKKKTVNISESRHYGFETFIFRVGIDNFAT